MIISPRQGDIAALTGLRGLAALLVVVDHFMSWTRVTAEANPTFERFGMTSGIGMAIFFTLSGYVIALSYSHWDWRERPAFNLVRLFLYRFARLFPAFFLFAILVVLRTPPIRDLSDASVQTYLASRFALVYTWLPIQHNGLSPHEDHFHVAWSLSVEAGLYLLFGIAAVVAATLPRWRYKATSLFILFFVVTWFLLHWALESYAVLAPGWNHWAFNRWLLLYSPWGVSLQFAIGVAAFRLSPFLSSRVASGASYAGGLGLLVLYAALVSGIRIDAWDVALLSALATGCVMVGSSSPTVTNALLSGRVIVYIGTISYSLYLFHYLAPSMGFNGTAAIATAGTAAYQALNYGIAIAMAVVLATGMYRLVEVPGRRSLRALSDRLLGIGTDTGAPLAAKNRLGESSPQ